MKACSQPPTPHPQDASMWCLGRAVRRAGARRRGRGEGLQIVGWRLPGKTSDSPAGSERSEGAGVGADVGEGLYVVAATQVGSIAMCRQSRAFIRAAVAKRGNGSCLALLARSEQAARGNFHEANTDAPALPKTLEGPAADWTEAAQPLLWRLPLLNACDRKEPLTGEWFSQAGWAGSDRAAAGCAVRRTRGGRGDGVACALFLGVPGGGGGGWGCCCCPRAP
jgi:hypothetical protein